MCACIQCKDSKKLGTEIFHHNLDFDWQNWKRCFLGGLFVFVEVFFSINTVLVMNVCSTDVPNGDFEQLGKENTKKVAKTAFFYLFILLLIINNPCNATF